MKKIYIAHSTSFNFKNNLYSPIKNSSVNTQNKITYPHETVKFINSKEIIKNSDVVIAEISYPSTGEGIELGWANIYKITIIFIYKQGSKISNALRSLSKHFIVYKDSDEMIRKLIQVLQSIKIQVKKDGFGKMKVG